MRTLIIIAGFLVFTSCNLEVETKSKSHVYLDEYSKPIFIKAINAYKKEDYTLADSLFTSVIDSASIEYDESVPKIYNPYYFRSHLGIELEKYQRVISDLTHVASYSTTDTDVMSLRGESFRMLKYYDSAIAIANRLLQLNFDSSAALSLRGASYYRIGELEKACKDLRISQNLGGDSAYLSYYLKDCK